MDKTLSEPVLVCVVLFASALCAQTPPGEKIYVGVLDDAREEMVNWKPGVAQERFVRPVFEKTASGWNERKKRVKRNSKEIATNTTRRQVTGTI